MVPTPRLLLPSSSPGAVCRPAAQRRPVDHLARRLLCSLNPSLNSSLLPLPDCRILLSPSRRSPPRIAPPPLVRDLQSEHRAMPSQDLHHPPLEHVFFSDPIRARVGGFCRFLICARVCGSRWLPTHTCGSSEGQGECVIISVHGGVPEATGREAAQQLLGGTYFLGAPQNQVVLVFSSLWLR
jgi:hypothetical protein